VHQGGGLIAKINEYLGHHLPGWELEVVTTYEGASIGLKSTITRGLWVSITDTGTGVAQILPVLLRRAQDELDPPTADVLEIVEEPELNLHPSAQSPLADLYIAAAERTRVRFLIETHSETFLLRLRRRIAERRLDPEMLALYFVDSTGETATVRRINVDELGRVDYWPQGIFTEDFEEVRAMAEAQGDRVDADAS
jgi:predicted ATPase